MFCLVVTKLLWRFLDEILTTLEDALLVQILSMPENMEAKFEITLRYIQRKPTEALNKEFDTHFYCNAYGNTLSKSYRHWT